MKFLNTYFLALSLVVFSVNSNFALAQDEGGGESTQIVGNPLKDLSTVFAIGLGGAILGASTLSFVDEPSEHLRSIVVGGAIGIIIGVGVVAFKQATVSKDYYEDRVYNSTPELNFTSIERSKWHKKEHQNYQTSNLPLSLNFSSTF